MLLDYRGKPIQPQTLQSNTTTSLVVRDVIKKHIFAKRVSERSDVYSPNLETYLPRQNREYHYKNLEGIQAWSTERLLRVLIDIEPEASAAVANYLRIFDSGIEFEVEKFNGDPHVEGNAALQDILRRLRRRPLDRYTHPKGIRPLNLRFALDALLKGAISCEMVFNEDHELEEIAYVDPWTIHFKWKNGRLIPYQNGTGFSGEPKELDIPTFFYIPIDPEGDDPYGRSALISAIRPILFKIRVMSDLSRVIHGQGFPRIDITVLEDKLYDNAPPEIKNDPKKLIEYVNKQLDDVEEEYKNLAPDDHLIHTNSVELGYLETKGGGKGMFAPKELLDVIDSQIINGLKTVATLLSKRFGGSTEGYTSAEITLFLKLIKGYHKTVKELYDPALSLVLQVEKNIMRSEVNSIFKEPTLRSDTETAVYISNSLSNFERVRMSDEEFDRGTRKLVGLKGDAPDGAKLHLNDNTDTENQPERPEESEDDKEKKRKETNRERRSGEKK